MKKSTVVKKMMNVAKTTCFLGTYKRAMLSPKIMPNCSICVSNIISVVSSSLLLKYLLL